MKRIVIHQKKVTDPSKAMGICPFNAIDSRDNNLEINAGCKMCGICVKQLPEIFSIEETDESVSVDKDEYEGIVVYIDHFEGDIHPVSYELIGKALEMGGKINHPVHAVFIGDQIIDCADELIAYGVDKVFVYEDENLKDFRIEPYTAVMEDYINNNKPSIVLVGGTVIGRSLAPRVAARFRTGLTADCTILDVQENTDLDQIRPAFGGNIMAHIHTPNHRPQFATVRYKIFNQPEKRESYSGEIIKCDIDKKRLQSDITIIDILDKEPVESIEDAEAIVVVGSGFAKEEDLTMAYELADLLGAKVASTRPLIEKGWMDPKSQIGLSGRTVRPKILITCGVSGAIQFVAGMSGAENIIAINVDKKAPIFDVAHYGIVGDVYEIVPRLIDKIKNKNHSLVEVE